MKKMFEFAILAITIFSLLFFADGIKACVTDVAKMWAFVLLPSLFPYLVLTKYMTSSKALSFLGFVENIISRIFGISKRGASVYLCSLFAGYPSGAICVAELYKNKEISLEEAERLICFTNNPSPVFLICAVGGSMLGSEKDGIALYLIQMLSASMWAIATKNKNDCKFLKPALSGTQKVSFCKCVSDSTDTMVKIGGYVIISAVIGKIICLWCEFFNAGNNLINNAVIFSVIEISNGVKSLCVFGNTDFVFVLMCVCSAWGGISVIMQIMASAPNGIRAQKVVGARIAQCGVSIVLGVLYRAINICSPHIICTDIIWKASVILSASVAVLSLKSLTANTERLRFF